MPMGSLLSDRFKTTLMSSAFKQRPYKWKATPDKHVICKECKKGTCIEGRGCKGRPDQDMECNRAKGKAKQSLLFNCFRPKALQSNAQLTVCWGTDFNGKPNPKVGGKRPEYEWDLNPYTCEAHCAQHQPGMFYVDHSATGQLREKGHCVHLKGIYRIVTASLVELSMKVKSFAVNK